MATAQYFESEVQRIISAIAPGEQIQVQWSTAAEARAHKRAITQAQKELRLVKKELGLHRRAINGSFTAQKVEVGKGLGSGIMKGLFGGKSVGKMNAVRRESLRADQTRAVAPYDAVNLLIDRLITQLDGAKAQIDSQLV